VQPEHGAGVQQVQRKISVRDRIEGVVEGLHTEFFRRELRIYGMGRSRQGGSPERRYARRLARRLQPPDIPLERPEVGEQVVGEQHRLGPLEVRVAGEDQGPLPLGHLEEREHRGEHCGAYLSGRVPDEEMHVEGDLIVPTPARV
jgi:hypothetical protein